MNMKASFHVLCAMQNGFNPLLLEAELLRKRRVGALIGRFEVFQMLAAVGHEAEESAARALVLTILIQMCRKLFDAACQNRDLNLRRTGVRIVTLNFADFVGLFSLCQHRGRIAQSPPIRKGRKQPRRGRSPIPAGWKCDVLPLLSCH
jgi:hypothetical protein